MSVTVSPTDAPPVNGGSTRVRGRSGKHDKARQLLAGSGGWALCHRIRDGRPFFAVPGSKPGTAHWADQTNCTCDARRWAKHDEDACSHMLAVRLWYVEVREGRISRPGFTLVDRGVFERHWRDIAAREAVGDVDVEPDWEAYDREVALPDQEAPVWLQEGDRYEPDADPAAGGAEDPAPHVPAPGDGGYLDRLRADQARHGRRLRALDLDPADDTSYVQRAQWIERVEAGTRPRGKRYEDLFPEGE
jgi:hypothetical protein